MNEQQAERMIEILENIYSQLAHSHHDGSVAQRLRQIEMEIRAIKENTN